MVVVLADGVRNYMTKFLSKEWMVENGFLPSSELKDSKNPLVDVKISELNLPRVKFFKAADLTVGQALDIITEGQIAIPIINNEGTKIIAGIFQNKLLEMIQNKNLTKADLSTKILHKDFAALN